MGVRTRWDGAVIAKGLCFAILAAAAAIASGQTTNGSISVGGGTLTYQEVESTKTCGQGGTSSYTEYDFGPFTYSAAGLTTSTINDVATYLSTPGYMYCPPSSANGWEVPTSYPIQFPGYLITLTLGVSSSQPQIQSGAIQFYTTTTTTSSLNPSVYGQNVTFSATVAPKQEPGLPAPPPVAAGTVTFEDGTTIIGTAATTGSGSDQVASLTTSALGAGAHSITAVYGETQYTAGSTFNALTQTVNKATPSVSVSCSPNPITYGSQTTNCTASVSGGATGSIAWTINGGAWTTTSLSGGRTSAGGFNGYAAGSYTIGASYSGDANNNAGSASTTLTIAKATPSVSVSCSPNPITFGGANTTCTAAVTSGATGSVTFLANGGTWTTVSLSGNTASAAGWGGGSWAVGTYSVGVTYSGDGNYNSASASSTVSIGPAATTTTVTSTLNPSVVGQTVDWPCTVTSTAGTPAGTISYTWNGSYVTSATLSGGTVTGWGGPGLPAGTGTVGCSYAAQGNYAASSGTITQVVKAIPTVSVSCSPNPITYGTQTSTCTASVSGGATGTVALYYNGNYWKTLTLAAGSVSATGFSGLSAGTYTVLANYSGDANNSSASGSATVTIANAALTVTAQNASRVYGAGNPAFTYAITGFVNGDTASSATTGAPSLTTTATASSPAGSYAIAAAAGTLAAANYSFSFVNGTLTVSKATPSVAVSCSPNAITYGTQATTCTVSVGASATGTVALSYNGTAWATPTLSGGSASATGLSGQPVGSYSVAASYSGDANNNAATGSTTLTINKATPTIAWPQPAAIATGTALGSAQLDATSPVAGTFAYSPTAGTVLTAGSYTLTATFTPSVPANYTTASASVGLVVGAPPAISWTAPAAITYGTPLSATQLNAISSAPGTFSYSPADGAVVGAGTQTLTATFIPTNPAQSPGATASVPLTVYPALPKITWPAPADMAKGSALGAAQLNASTPVAGTMTYSPASGTVLAVGPHTLTATFAPSDAKDYYATTATNYVTVAEGIGTYDSGTVTLAVNGSTIATVSYGKGSTATSVAAALAAAASSSLVSVAAVDDALYISSKASGAGSDYTYSLSAVSGQPSAFAQPSFAYPTLSGALGGGVVQGADSGTVVYSYTVPTGGYDAVGNLLKYSDNSAAGPIMGTWTFAYDNLNRLAGSTDSQPKNPSADYCWSYDSFGNRTTQAGSNQPFATGFSGTPATNPCTPASSASLANTSASYNALNRMSGSTQVPAGVPYDASGDVLNDGATQYLYDAEGRVCASANTPAPGFATMTGYIYDADGLRVAKGTISQWSCDPGASGFTTASDYVLGPGGEQVAEYGAGPSSGSAPGAMAWQHSNVWAAGKLLATYDKDGLHFYLDDPLGSRRVQTDFAGATEQTCASLPFGDALSCSGSTQFPTEHHFTGKERDVESGLDYFGARYYASNIGRFMSPDWSDDPDPVPFGSLSDPQSLNLYAYVNNNPLNGVDLDGHEGQPNLTDRFGCPDGGYCDGSSSSNPCGSNVNCVSVTARPSVWDRIKGFFNTSADPITFAGVGNHFMPKTIYKDMSPEAKQVFSRWYTGQLDKLGLHNGYTKEHIASTEKIKEIVADVEARSGVPRNEWTKQEIRMAITELRAEAGRAGSAVRNLFEDIKTNNPAVKTVDDIIEGIDDFQHNPEVIMTEEEIMGAIL